MEEIIEYDQVRKKLCELRHEKFYYLVWDRAVEGGRSGEEGQGICKTNENSCVAWFAPCHRFQYMSQKGCLPDGLQVVLRKNKQADSFFDSLSFTSKKEYIECKTAKKEETRKERVQGTLERLLKNWKNPRNS
ncbi:MAG: hypothetical protein C5B59_13340 [Bacteroidetes bacterium]|nr:MAG: hypothetical protein C5B59_13340 [Bacteroidota bacterium]